MNPDNRTKMRALHFPDGKFDLSKLGPDPRRTVSKLVIGVVPIGDDQKKTVTLATSELQALISGLPALTHLYLWGVKGPKELPALPEGLVCLDVRNCQDLRELPERLPGTLEFLDVGVCGALTHLPKIFPDGLKELYLNDCPALKARDGTSVMPPLPLSLEVMDATNTPAINQLPVGLLDPTVFTRLRDLRVVGEVKFGVQVAGGDVLKSYLGQNALEGLRPWWRGIEKTGADTTPFVKVFLLGNGQAGKTQVRRLMKNEELNPDWDSTHGAQLDSLAPGAGQIALTGVGLTLWDFGGQDIYHGTHALFTDGQALYVLVWTQDSQRQGEGRKWCEPKPLKYWLEYVSALSRPEGNEKRKPCRIVVAESGKTDGKSVLPLEIPSELDAVVVGYDINPRLKAEYQVEGGKVLLEMIRSHAARVAADHASAVPNSWSRLRDEVRSDAVKARNLLSESDFEGLCRTCGITDGQDVPGVRKYLHQCGAIFHRPGLFDGRVVVNQQWAFDAIYAVLDRSQDGLLNRSSHDGSFSRQELQRTVWKMKTGDEARVLIEMMEECGVCFQWGTTDRQETRYLAPELLPTKAEVQSTLLETLKDSYQAPLRSQTFHYDFLHDGIMRGIMAKTGALAGTGAVYWKGGFCVYERETRGYVVVESAKVSEAGKGTITAQFFGPPDSIPQGPWSWIVGLLQEQRPNPDPADLEAAKQANRVGTPQGTGTPGFGDELPVIGVRTVEKDKDRGGNSDQPQWGRIRWVFTTTGKVDFETSGNAVIKVEKILDNHPSDYLEEERNFSDVPTFTSDDLQSYLDQTHLAPVTFEVRASEDGKKILRRICNTIGEQDDELGNLYFSAMTDPKAEKEFRFKGSPLFQAKPWELIRRKDGTPTAISSSIRRHQYRNAWVDPVFPTGDRLKVLWVTARPLSPTGAMNTGPNSDALLGPVRAALNGSPIDIKVLELGSLQELQDETDRDYYHIVHLDMHARVMTWEDLLKWKPEAVEWGDRGPLDAVRPWDCSTTVLRFAKAGLNSKIVPVTAVDLAKVLTDRRRVPLVVLNACKSGTVPEGGNNSALPAYLLDAGMAGVLGFQGFVSVELAAKFFPAFYRYLSPDNRGPKIRTGDVEAAVQAGREELRRKDARGNDVLQRPIIQKEDWWVPVLYANQPLLLFSKRGH